MSFKLLVVFALIGLVAAELSEKERLLHVTIGQMERALYHDEAPMEPEAARKAVGELVEHLYEELPLPEQASSVDTWVRQITVMLYSFGQVNEENCEQLDEYNQAADLVAAKYAHMPNAVRMLRFYQQKQNEICESS